MSRPVGSVVVVGRDAALWLTALSLQRAFARTGLKVKVVELPSYLPAVEAYVAMPPLAALHRLLGLSEDEILAQCAGVYSLGQRFVNWAKAGEDFMNAYDTVGAPLNNVDFIQYFTAARARGLTERYEDFSLAAVVAKQGRMVVHTDDTDRISTAAHGYHLDARSYARFLTTQAARSGVTYVAGPVRDVARNGETITGLTTAEGQVVEGDLFVDLSVEGVLIEQVARGGFEPWSWFACDRILSASAAALSPLPGFAQVAAGPAGWIGVYPLQGRTALTAVYSSQAASERDMLRALASLSRNNLMGEPMATPFRAGARRSAWVGNCVAIGEAAARAEPLDAAPMQILQTGISHLVALFPVDADNLLEAEIYNAALASHLRNIRDFQIAHYKLNGRTGEPLWDRARSMAAPDELAYKIAQFQNRGRVPIYDDETFQEANWASVVLGHGLKPRSYDPLVDQMPQDEQSQKLQDLLTFMRNQAAEMPSVDAQLEMATPSSSDSFF
jgi:tryptophan halogenase